MKSSLHRLIPFLLLFSITFDSRFSQIYLRNSLGTLELESILLIFNSSQSQGQCYWQFTVNQFGLVPSPLRLAALIFFQLNSCGHTPYVTSSLTRGWVCRLQLLLVLASAVIPRSESRGNNDHILLPQIRDSPNMVGQFPIFIPPPPEQGGPVIAPGIGFPFRRLLRLAGRRWRYSNPSLWGTSKPKTMNE
jgi:hypothetical protein